MRKSKQAVLPKQGEIEMLAAKPLKGIPRKPMRLQLRKRKIIKQKYGRAPISWPKRKYLFGNRFTMNGTV